MFSRVGSSAYKKDLTNTLSLCEFFGNPQLKFRSIHIGGTNGKGSTTNYLASIFIEAGKKVGIYTSPHLVDFRERIKIGNLYIDKEFVIQFVEKAKPLIAQIQPSFFELTVVMAFEYFAQQKVDIAMIEVGLGGRLDSTNVISPIMSIITNVSIDHTNMLGNTLESIATEKAGIIKPNIPIVIGEFDRRTFPIFEEKAFENQAPIYCAEHLTKMIVDKRLNITIDNKLYVLPIEHENLSPSYKLKNIITVFQAISLIYNQKLVELTDDNFLEIVARGIQRVYENTKFIGRWTKWNIHGKQIILECAHNEAGIEEMKKSIEKESFDNLYIIYGTVSDKDLEKIISILPRKSNYNYILTQANIPRALPASDLANIFSKNKISYISCHSSVSIALKKTLELAQPNDIILVAGSIFLVGEIVDIVQNILKVEV